MNSIYSTNLNTQKETNRGQEKIKINSNGHNLQASYLYTYHFLSEKNDLTNREALRGISSVCCHLL